MFSLILLLSGQYTDHLFIVGVPGLNTIPFLKFSFLEAGMEISFVTFFIFIGLCNLTSIDPE